MRVFLCVCLCVRERATETFSERWMLREKAKENVWCERECVVHERECVVHERECVVHTLSCVVRTLSCVKHPLSCVVHVCAPSLMCGACL